MTEKLYLLHVTTTLPTHEGEFEAGSDIFVTACTMSEARQKAWADEANAVGAVEDDDGGGSASDRHVSVDRCQEIRPEHVPFLAIYFPEQISSYDVAKVTPAIKESYKAISDRVIKKLSGDGV